MSSPAVALAVFERWMIDGALLTLFTPQGVGEASSHSAKVVAVDADSLVVSLRLDDRTPKSFALRDASVAYVEQGDKADDTPEQLRICFAGRFLKLSFPSGLLFVVGETLM